MEIFHLNSYQLTLEEEGVLEIENLKIYIFTNEIQSVDKSSIPEKFVGMSHTETKIEMKQHSSGLHMLRWFSYIINSLEVSE